MRKSDVKDDIDTPDTTCALYNNIKSGSWNDHEPEGESIAQ